jgi:hypothetical protein
MAKVITLGTNGLQETDVGGGEAVNIEALSADKTLTATDAPIQIYTITTNRIVNLPTTNLVSGQKFEIWNKNAYTDSYYITIKQGTTTIYQLTSQTKIELRWDTANWIPVFNNNVSIGFSTYNNYNYGTGIGAYTYNNYNYGTGIGMYTNTNYSYGTGIGAYAYSNYNYGTGIGYNANGNHDYGVGVGNGANNNNSYGTGVGNGANNNHDYGIGVGYTAANNNNSGTGVGTYAIYNSFYGTGIGYSATSNSKQYNTIALGAYSTAQRNRELVSTATQSTINKAQLTFQKFVEKDLASNSGAWQELFIDGTSARLTIIASSVYQFMIQINAIDKTNFNVKTWKVEGTIKRDGSNVTSIVGSVIKTIIAADVATANWDVQVTADDTNEDLKIEVKHDSANQVRYSLNVFATETRI